MTATLNPTDRFAALFESARAQLPGAGVSWLDEARAAALAAFSAQGLPTAKTEGWRFTPAKVLSGVDFEPAGRPKTRGGFGSRALCPVTFHRVVLQNGRVLPNGEGSGPCSPLRRK